MINPFLDKEVQTGKEASSFYRRSRIWALSNIMEAELRLLGFIT